MNDTNSQMSTLNTKNIIFIFSTLLTFLLGAALALGGVYFYKNELIASTMKRESMAIDANRSALSFSGIPECLPKEVKNGGDKDIIVYILKNNQMMTERLKSFLPTITDAKYKALISNEIQREEKESALMRSAYKAEFGEEYVAKNVTSSLEKFLRYPDNVFIQKELTEENKMSLLRGYLEYLEREYYSLASLSKNTVIKENATNFKNFKADFVSTFLKTDK